MSDTTTTKRPGQYDRAQATPHPFSGKWDAAPLGTWMDAREVAAAVGISAKGVTNRFAPGKCPAGWIVNRKTGGNWYMRVN